MSMRGVGISPFESDVPGVGIVPGATDIRLSDAGETLGKRWCGHLIRPRDKRRPDQPKSGEALAVLQRIRIHMAGERGCQFALCHRVSGTMEASRKPEHLRCRGCGRIRIAEVGK